MGATYLSMQLRSYPQKRACRQSERRALELSLAKTPLFVPITTKTDRAGSVLLIAATVRVHDLTLITSDRPIRKSGAVRTLW